MLPQILHRFFYGLISGIAECLPVSARAHQMIYRRMSGFQSNDPWLSVCVLAGTLASLIFCYRHQIRHLMHENTLSKPSRRRKSHPPEQRSVLTLRICRTVLIPVMLSILLYGKMNHWINGFDLLTVTLVVNGIILFIPRIVSSGNKDSFTMTRLDSMLMGLAGALGIIPGISRVGMIASSASARGTEVSFAVDLAMLIHTVALSALLLISFLGAFLSHTALNAAMVIGNLLALVSSFGGGCFAIWFLRSLCKKSSISIFAYYSWGAALAALALFLII